MEENLLPSITLPDALAIPGALDIPTPTLEQPTVEIPTFPTIVIAPTVLAPPVGVITADLEEILEEELARKQEGKPPKPKQEAAEVKRIDIPFTDLTFPVPKEEILITAGTTASVSVIATLTVTSLFKQTVKVMKPIIMQIAKRIQKKFNGNTTGKTEEPST
tara:strand:+ start:1854 stop:2339 length:486 start_codon:yes stop_codon:yes gene_type:complete